MNYGCEVTGVTLSKNQTKSGNDRIMANIGDPKRTGIYTWITEIFLAKIACLEMARV
jgi:hypothetical protein